VEEHALAESRRLALRQNGLVTETYRRVSVAEALQRLGFGGNRLERDRKRCDV
jgi:hypothetical protein